MKENNNLIKKEWFKKEYKPRFVKIDNKDK
jgi:hypothetical protein